LTASNYALDTCSRQHFDTEHSERCSLSLQQKGKVDDGDDASETASLTGLFYIGVDENSDHWIFVPDTRKIS